MKYWIVMWTSTCLGSAAFVVIFELKISKSIKSMGTIANRQTARMHAEFHRALLAIVSAIRIHYYAS